MRNWLYWPIIVAAVLILLFRVADRIARRGNILPKTPAPNAYEELISVAEKLNKFEREPSEMSRDEKVRMAEAERPVLEPVHALLRTNSAVLLKISTGWTDEHQKDIKKLKRLAVALAMQAGT